MESPTAGLQETERSVDVGRALSAAERETTVTITDADDLVRIWTAQRRYLGRLRRHPSFTEVKSGTHGGTEWAEFTIPLSQVDAVIAALGPVAVYGAQQDEDIVWGLEPDVATVRREWPGLPVVRRYITPWERIEEDR